jgi:hypothetical protein
MCYYGTLQATVGQGLGVPGLSPEAANTETLQANMLASDVEATEQEVHSLILLSYICIYCYHCSNCIRAYMNEALRFRGVHRCCICLRML